MWIQEFSKGIFFTTFGLKQFKNFVGSADLVDVCAVGVLLVLAFIDLKQRYEILSVRPQFDPFFDKNCRFSPQRYEIGM